MSTAHLLLCHTPPHHLPLMAQRAPQHHFYVHYDAKSDAGGIAFLHGLPNVSVLPQRIDVRWGGFSMIEATLALMQAALAQPQHQYFHLMSGDCLPLQTPEAIERQMAAVGAGCLFLTCENVPRLRYRVRFSLPHADTSWQRSLTGKCLTKAAQCADRLLPSRQAAWAGSQWFSADRAAWISPSAQAIPVKPVGAMASGILTSCPIILAAKERPSMSTKTFCRN